MKQTAVEWLVEELNDNGFSHLDLASDIIEQAKEMEKEQIIKAYKDGRSDLASNFHKSLNMSLEQYYNETFKKETK